MKKLNQSGAAVLIFILAGALFGAFIVFVGHLNQPGHVGVVTSDK